MIPDVRKIAAWIPVSQDIIDEFEEMRLTREQGPRLGPWPWEVRAPLERRIGDKRVLVPWPWRPAGKYRRTK